MSHITIMWLLIVCIPIAMLTGAGGIYFMGTLVVLYSAKQEYDRWSDEKRIYGTPGTVPDANALYKILWENMPYHRTAAIAGSHGEIASRSRGCSERIDYLWRDADGHFVRASFRNGKLDLWSLS